MVRITLTPWTGELQLFYNNVHCKHVMLAGSGDNGYDGFLTQYCSTTPEPSKVVLIESLPFARQIAEVAVKFRTTEVGDLFRKSKIERAPGSVPPTTYASRLKAASEPQVAMNLNRGRPTTTKPSRRPLVTKIYQNREGHRVDHPVRPWVDYEVVDRLKPRKLCNRYFLTANCPFHADTCSNSHRGTLSRPEIEALRYIARSNPCSDRHCMDPSCVAGHRCMHGQNCRRWNGHVKPCRFSDEMHTVDVRIDKIVDMTG